MIRAIAGSLEVARLKISKHVHRRACADRHKIFLLILHNNVVTECNVLSVTDVVVKRWLGIKPCIGFVQSKMQPRGNS